MIQELLPAYPSAIVEEDDEGRIPFTEAIIRWIEARRAVRKWKLETDLTREKVALVAARFLTGLKQHRASLEYGLAAFDDAGEENKASDDEAQRARGLPPLVEWCLNLLGEIVDKGGNIQELASRRGSNDVDDESDEDLGASFNSNGLNDSMTANNNLTASVVMGSRLERQSSFLNMMDTVIVEKVASIPNLLEELLLIEDPEARQRVFDMSIVKKVLFSIDSIGNGGWLITMLDKSISVQKQRVLDNNLSGDDYGDTAVGRVFQLKLQMAQEECRNLAESAIFYLERVSGLNIQGEETNNIYVFVVLLLLLVTLSLPNNFPTLFHPSNQMT